MLPLGHSELIDGEPVVVVRFIEVEYLRLRPCDRAIFAPILHRYAVHQHPVHRAVALQERRCIGARDPPVGVFQPFGRKITIETGQCLAQAAFQHHIAVVGSLRSAVSSPAEMTGPGNSA